MILYPAASVAARRGGVVPPVPSYSVEFGRVEYGNDYATRPDAPAGNGLLFSMWQRIPEQITTFPYVRGNMETFVAISDTWYLRCVTGNIVANSAVDCGYNANVMLLANGTGVGESNYAYIGDFAYLQDTGLPVATVNGFVFTAWQIVIEAANVTMRQWVKYAGQPVLGPFVSSPTFTQLRQWIVDNNGWNPANAANWTPTNPTNFSVGGSLSTCNGFYTKAQMVGRSDLPSNAEIEAIASRTAPDPAAWADWPITWDTNLGAADLADASGHNRPLILHPGGTLYQGALAVLT